MAKSLDELLKIPGVVAAGEFTPDGKLVNYLASMDMSREMAAMTAQFVATVSMMFNTLAGAYTQLSKMKWVPSLGWAYSGGDWTIAVMGNWGVFIETSKADFNPLLERNRALRIVEDYAEACLKDNTPFSPRSNA